MELTRSALLLAYVIAALVPFATAFFVWPRRAMPGGRWLFLLLLAGGSWALTQGISDTAVSYSAQIIGAQLSYIGTTASPVLLLLFALEYSKRVERVPPRRWVPLFAIPVISVVAVFTNEMHRTIWTRIEPMASDPQVLGFYHGPLYWVVAIYGFTLGLGATVVLLEFSVRTRDLHRRQSAAVIVAVLLPWVAELLYSTVPDALPWFDSSMAIGVGSAILAFVIIRYRLLDLVPIAREALVDQMPEGLLVIDLEGRVIDANPAARNMMGTHRSVIGAPLAEASPELAGLAEQIASADTERHALVYRSRDRYLSAESWPLRDGDSRVLGTVALLRDVSSEIHAEHTLVAAKERLDEWVCELERLQNRLHGPDVDTAATD